MAVCHRFFALLAGTTLLFGASGAVAQQTPLSVQDEADANCLTAISLVAGDDATPADKQAGLATLITFFVGKLKGRHPDIQLIKVMTPERIRLVTVNMPNEKQRCSREAAAIASELEVVSKALTEAGY